MITFEEKNHTYTHNKTKEQYISVTTLIDQYVPEYDEQYWSLYKAIKDILGQYNQFSTYKLSVGGWKRVVDAWRKTPLMKYEAEVSSRQEDYLLQWKIKRDNACDIGHAEHKRREDQINCQDYYEHEDITYETPTKHSQTDILHIQDFASNRVYTELLVYNDQYKVAGQIDWVRKKSRKVWIKDYKTNEEITKVSFMDETLKPPLNDLPNANWYKYAMQVSTYGWMLEQCGYELMTLELLHTRENKTHVIPYMKSHVERMMIDYLNTI